jgi:uroporphyrinogen decarboxylase
MKPRDRVEMALAHETPDRAPFQATFVPEFAARLRADLGLPPIPLHDPHNGRWNGYALELATAQDALQCSLGWSTNYYLDTQPYTDEWGVVWATKTYTTPWGPGFFTEMKGHPLADADALAAYQPPDPMRPELYTNLERLLVEHKSEHYIIGRLHCTIFETAWALRGFQQMLLDFLMEPELTHAILEIPWRYHKEVACGMAARGVDMIWLGDDMGSQKNMLISPATWRTFFKERMAALIADVRAVRPDITIAYHSDGSIYPIIPDLIEIGVDVLNPIQPDSMDPARLKQEYGDRLTFFGAIDVQNTLPFGTAAQVRAEVKERNATLGAGGGWICAPTHHVQADTPLENFWALVHAVAETGKG